MVCELVVPTVTPPNQTLPGVAVNAEATPVPLRGYFTVPNRALLVMLNVPDAAPPLVGVNVAVTVTLAPAAKVFGVVSPVTLNSAPDTDVPEIDTLAVPVFVIVTVIVCLDSSSTLPKLADAGVNVSVPIAGEAARSVDAPAVAIPIVPTRHVVTRAAALAARNAVLCRICRG